MPFTQKLLSFVFAPRGGVKQMDEAKETEMLLKLFEVYLVSTDKALDRRSQASSFFLGINSALLAAYGYVLGEKSAVDPAQKTLLFIAVPAAGVLVSLAWKAMLCLRTVA
jgi:hypothetical protein